MKFKMSWFALLGAVLLIGATVGCSGINTSQSVSPATFLLPGLMQNTPTLHPPAEPDTPLTPEPMLAQVR